MDRHRETVGAHLVGSVARAHPEETTAAVRDPALGSGPLATVIQDILSLLVYFAMVRAFGA